MYDSSHGEEAQLELMLAKLEQRREILETQKRDIENALEDLERIFDIALFPIRARSWWRQWLAR